jgi:hypothetical protein
VCSGWDLFIGFLKGFLIGPHVTTLADHQNMRDGFPGYFHQTCSILFFTIMRGGKLDGQVQS